MKIELTPEQAEAKLERETFYLAVPVNFEISGFDYVEFLYTWEVSHVDTNLVIELTLADLKECLTRLSVANPELADSYGVEEHILREIWMSKIKVGYIEDPNLKGLVDFLVKNNYWGDL